jgi:hypothetical protein
MFLTHPVCEEPKPAYCRRRRSFSCYVCGNRGWLKMPEDTVNDWPHQCPCRGVGLSAAAIAGYANVSRGTVVRASEGRARQVTSEAVSAAVWGPK